MERTSRKEQNVEEEEEEDEDEEEEEEGEDRGEERLIDAATDEDCGLDVGGYNSDKSLSPSQR